MFANNNPLRSEILGCVSRGKKKKKKKTWSDGIWALTPSKMAFACFSSHAITASPVVCLQTDTTPSLSLYDCNHYIYKRTFLREVAKHWKWQNPALMKPYLRLSRLYQFQIPRPTWPRSYQTTIARSRASRSKRRSDKGSLVSCSVRGVR